MKLLLTRKTGQPAWSTINDSVPGVALFMATYAPLIPVVEAAHKELAILGSGLLFNRKYAKIVDPESAVVVGLVREVWERFGVEPIVEGAAGLFVVDTDRFGWAFPVGIRLGYSGQEVIVPGCSRSEGLVVVEGVG